MKKNFFTVFIALNIFLSYSQKTTSFVDKSIIGNWQWINSIGGFTGHDTIKPEPNATVILILNPDHTYKRTSNGKIIAQGTYDIINVESIFDKSKQQAIRFDNLTSNN